jgi:hypothetical protein
MKMQQEPAERPSLAEPHRLAHPNPPDWRLLAARVAWLLLAVSLVGGFVASVPAALHQFQSVCSGSASCPMDSLAPGMVDALGALGLTPAAYAGYRVALEALSAAGWLLVAALLFWRRADDRMALFSAITLLTFGMARFPEAPLALAAVHPELALPIQAARFLGSACLSLFFYLFPTGRFVPRWMAIIGIVWVAVQIPEFFRSGTSADPTRASPLLQALVFLVFVASVAFTQVYRYRRDSTPTQRRQTRWVVYGTVIALAGYLTLAFVIPLVAPHVGGQGVVTLRLLAPTGEIAFMLLVPLSIGVAILRYRLFDIDLLINRTLVYGSLTLILAGIYFAIVLVAQSVIRLLTGQTAAQQPLVIVVTTLLIAALFQPLRRGLQAAIDRRFYRQRYDAARLLAGFGATLRSEVDLARLSERLVATVEEAVRPAHVSLWLRPPDLDGDRSRPDAGGGR